MTRVRKKVKKILDSVEEDSPLSEERRAELSEEADSYAKIYGDQALMNGFVMSEAVIPVLLEAIEEVDGNSKEDAKDFVKLVASILASAYMVGLREAFNSINTKKKN